MNLEQISSFLSQTCMWDFHVNTDGEIISIFGFWYSVEKLLVSMVFHKREILTVQAVRSSDSLIFNAESAWNYLIVANLRPFFCDMHSVSIWQPQGYFHNYRKTISFICKDFISCFQEYALSQEEVSCQTGGTLDLTILDHMWSIIVTSWWHVRMMGNGQEQQKYVLVRCKKCEPHSSWHLKCSTTIVMFWIPQNFASATEAMFWF